MFFPLGAEGARTRFPVVTLTIIAINVLAFLASASRVEADRRALEPASRALFLVERQIEARHRGVGAVIGGLLTANPATTRASARFWQRYESGLVVPVSGEEWRSWDRARHEHREVVRTTLFYRLGFRRDAPSLTGLLCHAFLHDGTMHLVGNMLFLWAVGACVEDSWGRRWFALLYALALVVAAASCFVSYRAGDDDFVVGASGAVAGVMGAMAVRHFRRPMRLVSLVPVPGYYRIAAGWLLLPWVAMQLVDMASPEAASSGVAFGAHVAGFAAGAALAAAVRLGGVEETVLAPAREAEARARAVAEAVEAAETHFRQGQALLGIDRLRHAIATDPDAMSVRTRLAEVLGTLGRGPEQAAEGAEILQRAWRAGRRDLFLETWRWLHDQPAGPPAATFSHRVATLLEATDAYAAAQQYARGLSEAPDDAAAASSFKRYAALLERLGEAEKARQVRAMHAAREARRRDAGLR